MERLIQYFEAIPSSHRALILAGGITVFWLIESAIPLFRFNYKKLPHAGINIFFTLTTVVINFLFAVLLVKTCDWVVAERVGVIQWLSLPLWVEVIIGLLLLDLVGAYFIHWLQHKIKPMWRFHIIHHTDTYLDTTSANRHHPGESVFRAVFTSLAALVAGTPIGIVMLYQSISVLLSQFNHANIQLPGWAERAVGWLLVTPNMHHVHHHYVLPHTNSNYGNIFPIWDRLFGTYMELEPGELKYGLDTHLATDEHSDIGNLLKIPFQKYRPPVGAPVKKQPETLNEP